MRSKQVKINDVLYVLRDQLIATFGDNQIDYIDNISDISSITTTSLDWINPNKKNKQTIVENTKAKVILVDENITYTESLKSQGKKLIVVKNPKKAIAMIGNAFFVEKPVTGIHPTAIIAPEAVIGENVSIGPYCIVGKSTIGDNTSLAAYVRIYDDVILGHDCKIRDGAILGGEGFGFEKNDDGNWMKFPQIGTLKIGNFVEVGPYSRIDRGALSQTEVGDYCKIGASCQIAHNCKMGNNCVLTGSCGIAGSCIVGDDVWFGPGAKVNNWLTIGSNAKICMGAMVLTNVKEGHTVFGNPARKFEL